MGSPDEKTQSLRQHYALHPHPEAVRAPLFQQGIPFFDPRDLIQVKYELLRTVQLDGPTITAATSLFGFARSTYYTIAADWDRAGMIGLLSAPPGPRHASKLTPEVLAFLQRQAAGRSAEALAQLVAEHFDLQVHPRSIERALARQRQKRGA